MSSSSLSVTVYGARILDDVQTKQDDIRISKVTQLTKTISISKPVFNSKVADITAWGQSAILPYAYRNKLLHHPSQQFNNQPSILKQFLTNEIDKKKYIILIKLNK